METGFLFAIAALFSHIIEWMKRSDSPVFAWINASADFVTKVVAAVIAFLSALSITTLWVVDPATNLATLTLGGIPTTLDQVLTLVTTAFTSYWFQKGYYLSAIKPHVAGVMVAGTGTGDDDGVAAKVRGRK